MRLVAFIFPVGDLLRTNNGLEGKYRGQEQKWFVARFTGVDSDINIATEHPEFLDWKWANPADLPGLIVPFKRALYTEIVGEFTPVLARLKKS